MARLEPVPDEAAAVADLGPKEGRALVIADYHAGYEVGLRYERGVDVPSQASTRRERLRSLLARTGVDHLVVLGDLMHAIGDPGGAERGELEVLFESFPRGVVVTLVRGNHDGAIEGWLGGGDSFDPPNVGTTPDEPTTPSAAGDVLEGTIGGTTVRITGGDGIRLGDVGCLHGHTWPARSVLEADVVCLGHDHPCVRLEDEVGGSRVERVWLRGRLDPAPFRDRSAYEGLSWLESSVGGVSGDGDAPRVVVVPAFNELAGGTWVNLEGQSFLTPFLPEGLAAGEAYLLDGTRLGPYRNV